ncbi:hypothetical protein [Pseudooceanicola sp.]|uniref:hypothetical protein n=1 Tax=Pseudooceanicola sp. TaxID=1914328 RepID=UPI0040597864
MKRIITTTALAVAVAGPALAASDYVNNGVIPPREYQLETVGETEGPDARTSALTDEVFNPRDAALIDQKRVNQYVFDSEDRTAEAGNYKSPEARYR